MVALKEVKTQQLLKARPMHCGPYTKVKAKAVKEEIKGHAPGAGAWITVSRTVQWWRKAKERVAAKVLKEQDTDSTADKDKHNKEAAKDMDNTEGKDKYNKAYKHGRQKVVVKIQEEAMGREEDAGNAVDRTLQISAQAMEGRSEC